MALAYGPPAERLRSGLLSLEEKERHMVLQVKASVAREKIVDAIRPRSISIPLIRGFRHTKTPRRFRGTSF